LQRTAVLENPDRETVAGIGWNAMATH
jgi:hypothetical protein